MVRSCGSLRLRISTDEDERAKHPAGRRTVRIPEVEIVPGTGRYLVAWYQGALLARLLNADGSPAGAPFPVAPGFGSYDSPSVAVSPVSQTIAAVFCGADDEIWAADLSPAAGTNSAPVPATSTPGAQPNCYPRMAACTRRAEWLVVASRGFANPVVQRIRRP